MHAVMFQRRSRAEVSGGNLETGVGCWLTIKIDGNEFILHVENPDDLAQLAAKISELAGELAVEATHEPV